MRAFRLFLPLAALLAGCSGGDRERTSLVLVVVDTLRADHVLDPEGRIETPHLAALAADGVLFDRAYTHTTWTLPSHTALFSSRPPYANGVTLNSQLVPEDLPLLAEWMAEHGYATRAVTSLVSLTPVKVGHGLDRGFATFEERMVMGYTAAEVIDEQVAPVIAELAEDGRPFFLFAHYCDPHEPYYAHGTAATPAEVLLNGAPVGRMASLADPEPFEVEVEFPPGVNRVELRAEGQPVIRMIHAADGDAALPVELKRDDADRPYAEFAIEGEAPVTARLEVWADELVSYEEARRRYALEVEYVDRYLGALTDALKRHGLYDDVLIVLTSDHGESLGEHGELSHGKTIYDEVLHVPLIVKPPADHPRAADLAERSGVLSRHVDLAPTMLELLDLPALPGQTGVSLLSDAERVLEAEMHYPLEHDHFALFDGRRKLVFVPDLDRFLMFDLEADPDETRDVLPETEDDLDEWKARLRHMAAEAKRTDVGLPPNLPPEIAKQLEAIGY